MSSEGSANHNGQADDGFAELSAILLGPERSQLAELRERVESPDTRAQDVAAVLAEAVRLRAGDKLLRKSLQPVLEEAIGISVRKNPRMLAELLFPIFGKAIRKAISSELEGMMQSLSQVLEQSFSLRSLEWRWEALRTQQSYAEIVLLRSILYRVEQVFLIHRRSGLLLLHAEAGSAALKDPEMVSGMLTAIQDFVRDSIAGAEGEDLDTVRMGEFTVVMAYGPQAILAGFVRGTVPRNLHRLIQDELDAVHEEQPSALAAFSGDTSKIEGSRPHLEKCLVGQGEAQAQRSMSGAAKAIVVGVPLLLVLLALGWWWQSSRAERHWRDTVARIEAEPGIVVTGSGQRGGRYYINGLKDPLAGDPAAMARAAGFSDGKVQFQWEPFHSLQPRFVAERSYQAAKEQLEKHAVRFTLGSSKIAPEQQPALDEAVQQIRVLFAGAAATGRDVKIEILGSTDPQGRDELNATLARDRALAGQASLAGLGVPRDRTTAEGLTKPCALVATRDDAQCRSASFRVLETGTREGSPAK